MGCGDSKPEQETKENGLSESLVSSNAPNPAAAPVTESKIHSDQSSLLKNADSTSAKAAAPVPSPVAKAAAPAKDAAPAKAAKVAAAPAAAPAFTGEETQWSKLNNNVTNGRKIVSWSEEAKAGDHTHFDWPKNKKGKSFHNYVITRTAAGFSLTHEDGEKVKEGSIDDVIAAMGGKH